MSNEIKQYDQYIYLDGEYRLVAGSGSSDSSYNNKNVVIKDVRFWYDWTNKTKEEIIEDIDMVTILNGGQSYSKISKYNIKIETSPINSMVEDAIKNNKCVIRLLYPQSKKGELYSNHHEVGHRCYCRNLNETQDKDGTIISMSFKEELKDSLIFITQDDVKVNSLGEKYISKVVKIQDILNNAITNKYRSLDNEYIKEKLNIRDLSDEDYEMIYNQLSLDENEELHNSRFDSGATMNEDLGINLDIYSKSKNFSFTPCIDNEGQLKPWSSQPQPWYNFIYKELNKPTEIPGVYRIFTSAKIDLNNMLSGEEWLNTELNLSTPFSRDKKYLNFSYEHRYTDIGPNNYTGDERFANKWFLGDREKRNIGSGEYDPETGEEIMIEEDQSKATKRCNRHNRTRFALLMTPQLAILKDDWENIGGLKDTSSMWKWVYPKSEQSLTFRIPAIYSIGQSEFDADALKFINVVGKITHKKK